MSFCAENYGRNGKIWKIFCMENYVRNGKLWKFDPKKKWEIPT